jgi:sigma-54-specific transcriptional regulator
MARLVAAWRELLAQGEEGVFDAVESALVHAAFEHGRQNQVRTAKAMGITRNMLRTLLKRHGLLGSQDEAQAPAEALEAH